MKKDIKRSLLKNSVWIFLLSLVNKIGSLIFIMILTRFLMPEKFGIYSITLSIAMIFLSISDLGLNQVFTIYASSALSKNKKLIPSYHRYLFRIKLFSTLFISLLLFFLSYPLSYYFFRNENIFVPLLISSVYIFVFSFEGFYTSTFYIVEKFRYVFYKEFLNQFIKIILSISVFYLISINYYVIGIFSVFVINSILLLFFAIYYTKKFLPNLFDKPQLNINKQRINKLIFYLSFISFFSILFSYVDSVLLGFFLSSEYVGYYRAAISLIITIAGILSFPTGALLPAFSKEDSYNTQKIFNRSFKYLMIITIPASFGIAILGKYFMKLIFGNSFLQASSILYFLSLQLIPLVGANIFGPIFSAKEKINITTKLVVLTSIINLILNIILIKSFLFISPMFATFGAAFASILSWYFYFGTGLFYLKKEFHFIPPKEYIIKPLLSSLLMSFVLIFLNTHIIKDMNLILGLSEVFLGAIIYFLTSFLIKSIKKEDLMLFKLLFKND